MPDVGVLSYNFLLGLFAFFAPCGFPMLPAYIAYYLPRDASRQEPFARALARGVGGGLLAAAGAFLILLAVGALAIAIGSPFKARVAYLELAGGLIVIALGLLMILRRTPSFKVALRPSQSRSALSIFGFGALYAATASSCVAPVLLGVLFPAFAAPSLLDGALQIAAYAAGMSVLLLAASVLIATSQERVVRAMRRALPHVEPAMGALLVAAGLYLIWYWAAAEFGIPAPPSLPAPT